MIDLEKLRQGVNHAEGGAVAAAAMREEAANEIERLRGALSLIAAMAGRTLLGPVFDEERWHEEGAAKAFQQCADIAIDALKTAD